MGLETHANSNALSSHTQDLAMPKQQDYRSRKPNDSAAAGKLNPHPQRQKDPKDVPVPQNNPGFSIHKKESPPDGLPLITLQSGIHLFDIKAREKEVKLKGVKA